MVFRELTMDDMKDQLNIKGSLFDILAATASRAKEIYEIEESTKIRDSPPPKKSRKRTAAAARISDDNGCASGSTSSKKRKYNSPSRRYNRQQQQDQPAPPLPEEVKKAIEEMATEPAKLVIQKELSITDMSSTHGRLSMPINQIRDQEFLTEEEKRFFRGYDGNNKNHKPVKIFEPSMETVIAKFCQWDMKKKNGGKMSSNYVINGGWNDIVRRNKLRAGMVLQVWGFRVEGNLGLALVRLPTN